jgi:hypothetical protein
VRIDLAGLTIDLTDDQVADLRQQLGVSIANGRSQSPELVDTATAAKLLGTGTEYVRERAAELGGQKLGNGPKARWRFDPAKLEHSDPNNSSRSAQATKTPVGRARRKQPRSGALLEVQGSSPYAR